MSAETRQRLQEIRELVDYGFRMSNGRRINFSDVYVSVTRELLDLVAGGTDAPPPATQELRVDLHAMRQLGRTHRMPRDPFAEQLSEAIFELCDTVEVLQVHVAQWKADAVRSKNVEPADAPPPARRIEIHPERARQIAANYAREFPADAPPPGALRETLAALAHEQWSGWMRYLFGKGHSRPTLTGMAVTIPAEWAERWMRQMNTPYAELSEAEKESDRKEADRVLALLPADALPALRALLQRHQEFADFGSPYLNYCWFCEADVNGKDGPAAPHRTDCLGVATEKALGAEPSDLPALRALVESVEALDPAASDDTPYGDWDAAKWRVFNAAVRFVKESALGLRPRSPREEQP